MRRCIARIVRFYDLPKETGAIVLAAENGSPAQKAGLREGDVIIAFAGQPIAGVDDLHRLLTDAQVDVKTSVTVLRRTERLELVIVPQESKADKVAVILQGIYLGTSSPNRSDTFSVHCNSLSPMLVSETEGITLQATVPAGLDRKEAEIYQRLDPERLPKHIAIIMDGNGRWARKRHLPRVAGHRAGVTSVRYVVEAASRIGIPSLTLYAFSEENWKRRPKAEVDFLMKLLSRYLKQEVPTLHKNNVRLQYIGRLHELAGFCAGEDGVGTQGNFAQQRHGADSGVELQRPLGTGGRVSVDVESGRQQWRNRASENR